jgi:hypothetical protein
MATTIPMPATQHSPSYRTTFFRNWTGDRRIVSLGTNAGSMPLAFQRWRNFKEAFAPEIVERAVRETPGRVRHVVDPFGGSGTTAIAAQFLGVRPTTIEVNPYLADLIEAKLAVYDIDRVANAFAKVCCEVFNSRPARKLTWRGAPPTFIEPGVGGRYIFSTVIADRLLSYLHAIDRLSSPDIRRLFRVLLGSIAVSTSNVVISGKGRRYRQGWQSRPIPTSRMDELFQERVLQAIYDLRLYESRACRDYAVLRGDCRKLLSSVETADLAVFSPPYPNSFDYTDVYNVELWALRYLDSPQGNRDLRNATLRSHVQIKRDMSGTRYSSRLLSKTLEALNTVRLGLWNKHIPEMIAAYVSDMGDVMSDLAAKLRPKGRVYMVIGDSCYAGVYVPITKILAQIAPSTGLYLIGSEACRSMRASPQQGGREELVEAMIILEKA